MRVVYLTANVDGAGCYRCLFPARELRRLGWDAGLCPHTTETLGGGQLMVRFQQLVPTDQVNGEGQRLHRVVGVDELIPGLEPDVVVVQMQLDRAVCDLIPGWQEAGIRVVAECDDAHLGIPAWNPALAGTDPKSFPDRNREWLHQSFQLADALTVATPALAEMYRHLQADVTVVPNYLHWPMWEHVVPAWETGRRRVRVGWMGDSKWRKGDLDVLRGVIGPWLAANPGVEFVAAGDPKVHDILAIPAGQRVSVSSVEFRFGDLADITAVMDIGLIPLADDPFNECKSYLKGLEYSACGIVPVASPTEQYRGFIREGQDGYLARKPKDWVRALDELVADPGLRERMGRNARAKARDEYSLRAHISEWSSLFERVRGNPDNARPHPSPSRGESVSGSPNGPGGAPGRGRRRRTGTGAHT